MHTKLEFIIYHAWANIVKFQQAQIKKQYNFRKISVNLRWNEELSMRVLIQKTGKRVKSKERAKPNRITGVDSEDELRVKCLCGDLTTWWRSTIQNLKKIWVKAMHNFAHYTTRTKRRVVIFHFSEDRSCNFPRASLVNIYIILRGSNNFIFDKYIS